ncbi:MAG: lytic transglycosylase domain-containing protein [Acetobacteraceae bacterium]|nr:lytic transglycosylase domain-containing protein [Acetobacteraceae bacterium]MBV8521227.1 lytic transglycosylase domain-containing protein [Acetobacteraceae bacterium]MBV8590160.1 lytic transglycosylase domain-containing protein [Acetobacteraceae bacterium]
MPVPYVYCMALVASIYGLPPRVLPAIQAVEGGRPGTVHSNGDGSADFGVMQVNTRWLQPLSRYTGLSVDVVRSRLILDPCFNIAAAGAILRTYLEEANGDLMQAIGYYHSHTHELGLAYQNRVLGAAAAMFRKVTRAPTRATPRG